MKPAKSKVEATPPPPDTPRWTTRLADHFRHRSWLWWLESALTTGLVALIVLGKFLESIEFLTALATGTPRPSIRHFAADGLVWAVWVLIGMTFLWWISRRSSPDGGSPDSPIQICLPFRARASAFRRFEAACEKLLAFVATGIILPICLITAIELVSTILNLARAGISGIPLAPDQSNPLTPAVYSLFLVPTCAFLLEYARILQRGTPIEFSSSGIHVKSWLMALGSWMPTTKVEWVEVYSISYSAPGTAQSAGSSLAETIRGQVYIDFISGKGRLHIDLSRLTREGTQQLLTAIDLWSNPYSQTPSLSALKHVLSTGADSTQYDAGFTSLWEESLTHQFKVTNYPVLEPGHQLRGGRLSISSTLTCGGFTAVYLAESEERAKVVLKECVMPLSEDENKRLKARELFQREGKLLAKLRHPRIAQLLDVFVEDDREYLVIEHVPGTTLRELVQRNGPLAWPTVVDLARQVCELLVYLHNQDPPIIHRDLTPDNLIVNREGAVILIDFGAANELIGTVTGTLIGKQCYLPPEQFRGRARSESDVYALGATMHWLLTGHDPEPLSQSHPREVRPEIPPAIDALVGSLTHQDPRQRPDSNSLIEQLNQAFTLAPAANDSARVSLEVKPKELA